MLSLLLIWFGLGLLLVLLVGRGPNGVLALSYFAALSVMHVPGLLAYMGPSPYPVFEEETRTGFELTLVGMAAFVGAVAVGRLLRRAPKREKPISSPVGIDRFDRLSKRFLLLGVGSYFVIMPAVAFIPSATSIVFSFGSLLLSALWLRFYVISQQRSTRRLMTTLMMLPLLPLSTLVTGGFLGFGTIWLVTVLAFLFSIARRRIWFILGAAPAIYLGLSLFVTYMHERSELRAFIWSDTGLIARAETAANLITKFTLLDLSKEAHQEALAGRLNQNFLIGLIMQRHENGYFELYRGGTVPLWALVPRAVWPDKPPVGGSGTLAADTSGLHFAAGTSVGIGQVAEFYINFGREGVVLGFFVWGLVLSQFDAIIRQAFARLDAKMFIAGTLPGLSLVQPLSSLLEILVSFVAALITVRLLRYFGLLDVTIVSRRPMAAPRRHPVA